MRHVKGYRKLGMESAHRRAFLRNMATSLLKHGRIETTVPRAKEIRKVVEKMITCGKKGTLQGRRQVEAYLFEPAVSKKVCTDIAKRFADRPGGYTRIIRLGRRFGDGANLCKIELVDFLDQEGK